MPGKKGSARGPGSKAPKAAAPRENTEKPTISREEIAGQQRMLNIFSNTFKEVLSSSASFQATLQEVKQDLFNREYASAFGNVENLEVYAARWSPTRTLCYASVFSGIRKYLHEILLPPPSETGTTTETETQAAGQDTETDVAEAETEDGPPKLLCLKTLSIGGAAAEIVAFGDLLH